MSISFAAVLAGTQAVAVGALVLAARSIRRSRGERRLRGEHGTDDSLGRHGEPAPAVDDGGRSGDDGWYGDTALGWPGTGDAAPGRARRAPLTLDSPVRHGGHIGQTGDRRRYGVSPGARPISEDLTAPRYGSLYGQIVIYTLLEGGVAVFDQLVERVVEQVRLNEPGTLAYVVHVVPSAPLQRIIYCVYRDQAAYHEHTRQRHIQEFEAGCRPLMLATNVIEVDVRRAKVSPFGPATRYPPAGLPYGIVPGAGENGS